MDIDCIWEEGRLLSGREIWGYSWLPLENSRLLHNVNNQPIIITSDNKLILFKRSEQLDFYPGSWSVSIEEQMVGPENNKPGDSDFFDCAERGVREEL